MSDERAGTVNRDAEVPDGDYYVSVIAGPRRRALLLGPYRGPEGYVTALANVQRGRGLAIDRFGLGAVWYLYGTCRAAQLGDPPRAVFGR